MGMLTDWTDEHTTKFQKEILTFGHDLASTGLFTDEALINLLEKHPADQLDVCTMGGDDHPLYPNKFRTGDFRDTSGEVLLDAVKAGKIWINVRKAMNIHPEYQVAMKAMYGGLSEKTGNKTFNARGGILISSPISQTPYHFDKTETILWHVRGLKRVYIYKDTQKFIADEDFENVISDDIMDDLPYREEFDKEATIIDLKPGMAATWPLNTPHRVDNSEYCVSVTTEYSTRESAMKNAAMLTNATLRHKFGMNPSYAEDGEFTRQVKSIFGRVLSKSGFAHTTKTPDLVSFKIDPSVPGFIVDTEPKLRDF